MSHPTVMYPDKRGGRSLNKVKSPAALAAANMLKNSLGFKIAKNPEAVSVRPASYIHIKPDTSLARTPKEKEEKSDDDGAEEESEDESEDYFSSNETPQGSEEESSSSESDEDDDETVQFGNDDDDDSSEEDENEEQEVEEETTVAEYRLLDINEDPNDKGSRAGSTICKSWNNGARSPKGLLNTGVTCYMNTAIQALLHVPPFSNFLINVHKGNVPEISNKSVTKELAQLQHKLLDSHITRNIYPAAIIKRLDDINPMMSMWQQEDSHEYFMSLLSRVQEDTVPPGKKLRTSILHEIFGGTYLQTVTCQTCKTVSTTHQDFYDLPVSFSSNERKARSKFTLSSSINEFFSPATIKSDKSSKTGYDCEKCKKLTTAVALSRIEEPSEYLAINIKRFNFKEKSSRKIKDPISYPMELDLTAHSINKDVPLKYKLISATMHEGRTTSSGHYVVFCQQPNNTWALYDDESVRRVTEKVVLRHEEDVYFLVYARLTPVQTTNRDKVNGISSAQNGTAAAKPELTPMKAKAKSGKLLRRSKSMSDLASRKHKLASEPSTPTAEPSQTMSKKSKKSKHGLKSSKSTSNLRGLSNGSVKSPHSALARMSDKLNRRRQEKKRALEAAVGHKSSSSTSAVERGMKKQKLDGEIDKIFGSKKR